MLSLAGTGSISGDAGADVGASNAGGSVATGVGPFLVLLVIVGVILGVRVAAGRVPLGDVVRSGASAPVGFGVDATVVTLGDLAGFGRFAAIAGVTLAGLGIPAAVNPGVRTAVLVRRRVGRGASTASAALRVGSKVLCVKPSAHPAALEVVG